MRYFVGRNRYSLVYISSGKFQSEKNFIHPKRTLDTSVIIVCLTGTVYISQGGHKFILHENEYIILFSGYEHLGFQKSKDEVSYFYCHFKTPEDNYRIIEDDRIGKIFNANKMLKPPDTTCELLNDHFSQLYILPEHGEISTSGRTVIIFRQLLDLTRDNCYSENLANCALSLLAMEITQEYIVNNFYHHTQKQLNQRLESIIEWIRINYNRKLTAQEIAQSFNYNPDYLSAAFRKYIKLPLMQYIYAVRIANAKRLLLNTDAYIKEIAYKTGFSNEKSFMKHFKKQEDTTPTAYRNAFSRLKIVKQ
jgi:YesN/AraC family two-component response regulator